MFRYPMFVIFSVWMLTLSFAPLALKGWAKPEDYDLLLWFVLRAYPWLTLCLIVGAGIAGNTYARDKSTKILEKAV